MRTVFCIISISLLSSYVFGQAVSIVPRNGTNQIRINDTALLGCGKSEYQRKGGSTWKEFDPRNSTSYSLDEGVEYMFRFDCLPGMVFFDISSWIVDNPTDRGNIVFLNTSSIVQIDIFNPLISFRLSRIIKEKFVQCLLVSDEVVVNKLAIRNDLFDVFTIDTSIWDEFIMPDQVYEIKIFTGSKNMGNLKVSKKSLKEDIAVSINAEEVYVDCENKASHILFSGMVSQLSYPAKAVWNLYYLDDPTRKIFDPIVQEMSSQDDVVAIEVQRDQFYFLELSVFDACHSLGQALYRIDCSEDNTNSALMLESSNTHNLNGNEPSNEH